MEKTLHTNFQKNNIKITAPIPECLLCNLEPVYECVVFMHVHWVVCAISGIMRNKRVTRITALITTYRLTKSTQIDEAYSSSFDISWIQVRIRSIARLATEHADRKHILGVRFHTRGTLRQSPAVLGVRFHTHGTLRQSSAMLIHTE